MQQSYPAAPIYQRAMNKHTLRGVTIPGQPLQRGGKPVSLTTACAANYIYLQEVRDKIRAAPGPEYRKKYPLAVFTPNGHRSMASVKLGLRQSTAELNRQRAASVHHPIKDAH